MIPEKTDGLRKLRIAISMEYSTKKAVQILYNFYSEVDEVLTPSEEETTIQELLKNEEQENDQFFIEAVDWRVVRPTVVMMLNQATERMKI